MDRSPEIFAAVLNEPDVFLFNKGTIHVSTKTAPMDDGLHRARTGESRIANPSEVLSHLRIPNLDELSASYLSANECTHHQIRELGEIRFDITLTENNPRFRFSQPGFSSDEQAAIVYLEYLMWGGYFYVFHNRGESWERAIQPHLAWCT